MWERIVQRYNSRRGSHPERSLRSIQSRWDIIRTEVTLFASFYAKVHRENPSGMSDADKTTRAVGEFASVQKKKFGLLHCWELMKDAPKWQDPPAREIATAVQGQGFVEGTNADGQSSPTRSRPESSRPMGRDSAKAAKKKANTDASSTSSAEYAAKMQDLSLKKFSLMEQEAVRKKDRFQQLTAIDEKRYEAMQRHNERVLQLEQEKIQLMREKQDDERSREDERILAIDLDSCTPQLCVYYQALQEDIMEKITARRQRNLAP